MLVAVMVAPHAKCVATTVAAFVTKMAFCPCADIAPAVCCSDEHIAKKMCAHKSDARVAPAGPAPRNQPARAFRDLADNTGHASVRIAVASAGTVASAFNCMPAAARDARWRFPVFS